MIAMPTLFLDAEKADCRHACQMTTCRLSSNAAGASKF